MGNLVNKIDAIKIDICSKSALFDIDLTRFGNFWFTFGNPLAIYDICEQSSEDSSNFLN